MSTDAAGVVAELEPEDDATLVVDEIEERTEAARADLVKKVTKMIGAESKPAPEPKTKQTGGEDKKVPAEDAASKEEKKDEKTVELSQSLKSHAAEAGISEDLALRLAQSGLLEESLAAFDRQAIDRVAAKSDKPKTPPKPKEGERAVKKEEEPSDEEAPPPLSGEAFDDELVKRDAYFQKRIEQLEAKLGQLNEVKDGRFQRWFTKQVSALKKPDLFGTGAAADDSPELKNRQTLCDGYERICEARGVDPYDCHADLLERAFPAMFKDEVFKAAQRETVERLRNAEGKFLTSAKTSGSPPSKRNQTPEEARADLLKKVQGILDR